MNEQPESLPEPPIEPNPTPLPGPTRRSRLRRFGRGAVSLPPISWLGRIGRIGRLRPSQPFLLVLFLLVLGVSAALTVRKYCLHHVPSGHMMILIAKFGEAPPEGQVLAGPGQKGIREAVYGEGWHFVWPVLYETEIKKNIQVPGVRDVDGTLQPAKVGIVKALGGTPLPAGEFLASRGQQGIWREVLLPGSYRLNPYGYEVKLVDMVEVQQGFVGVKRRKLGRDAASEFAQSPLEKGIIRDVVLQPGRYPINTEEYEIISGDVGIYQTTYHYTTDEKNNTALVFDASDSNRIQLDCTIEWELKPEFWPTWVAKFRNLDRIESAVIKLNVKNISRNKGQDYGAEDFLDGVKREQFQLDFMKELQTTCAQDSVVVRHAFIRNIIIPDTFLKPKRDEQLAKEKAIAQKEQTLTAETQNEVIKAERTVLFEVAKVEATTQKMVAAKEAELENLNLVTNAALERMKDESSAKQSILDAQRKELLGKAEAESKTLVSTAKSGLFKQQMDVFKGDSDSFLRYTVAQKMNPNLRLRLFQSGPGTFWTNMGDKAMNLFLPGPGGSQP